MKIITIGDIHGRAYWKQALEKEADVYVFLGDYLDPEKTMPMADLPNVIPNLKKIVEAKIKQPNKIVLRGCYKCVATKKVELVFLINYFYSFFVTNLLYICVYNSKIMAQVATLKTQTNTTGSQTNANLDLKIVPQNTLPEISLHQKTEEDLEREAFEKEWNDPTNLTGDELFARVNKHIDSLPWQA